MYTVQQNLDFRLGDVGTFWSQMVDNPNTFFRGNLSFAVLLGGIWTTLVEAHPQIRKHPALDHPLDTQILDYFADHRAVFSDATLRGREVKILGPDSKEHQIRENAAQICVPAGRYLAKLAVLAGVL